MTGAMYCRKCGGRIVCSWGVWACLACGYELA